MAQGHPIQTAFNAGVWGPLLDGRVEHARYPQACSVLENFIPTLQGAAVKRPGTRFVAPAKYDDKMARFKRFEYSQEQAYMLEFGDLYMRAHRNNATVLNTAQAITTPPTANNPVTIGLTGHGYVDGQTVFISGSGMSEINDRFFVVTGSAPNAFSLADENGSGRATGVGGTAASVFELVTTYLEADVSKLQFEQSNDTLYVAHRSYPPTKITRTSDTAWSITEIQGVEPPFNLENADESITIIAAAPTGTSVAVTASTGTPFTADMVGGYIKIRERYASQNPKWLPVSSAGNVEAGFSVNDRLYNDGRVYEVTALAGISGNNPPVHESGSFDDGGGWVMKYVNDGYGYAKVTAFTDSQNITVDIDTSGVEFPASATVVATHRWSFGAWSPKMGYPGAVAFYEDRLLWAGTVFAPQGIWGSVAGNYENYKFEGENAEGLFFVLNSRRQNSIEWMRGEKVLFIGTTGAEFTLDGGAQEAALSRENFRLKSRSFYGARSGSSALQIDNAILFPQRAGRKVHELVYDFDTDRYVAPDLTAFNEEILDGIVKGMSDLHEPWRAVFPWMEDGTFASMTYIKEEEVNAWASHLLGGTDSKVLSCDSIPHPDGDEDQLWLLTERTISGATKRYVEIMEKRWEVADPINDAFYVDCGLTYSGPSVTKITGLDHLEGETVDILSEGSPVPPKVVVKGAITLESATTKAQIGLRYTAKLRTMRFETGGAAGTAQGKTKRAHKLVIRVYQTMSGLMFGADFDPEKIMDEVFFFENGDLMDTPIPLLSGDSDRLPMPTGYSKEGYIALKHESPGPCQILAVMPMFKTQEGL